MKRLALAVLLIATTVAADDLVDAAKAAKAKRKKSATKVITNADVKKSKGAIAETKLVPLPETKAEPSLVEQHEAKKKAAAESAQQLSAAKELVGKLAKELAAIEQKYYEENDLNRRDTEVVRQFNEVKKKLDAARAALDKLTSP
jgi:Cu/Ag efflux protein CusF